MRRGKAPPFLCIYKPAAIRTQLTWMQNQLSLCKRQIALNEILKCKKQIVIYILYLTVYLFLIQNKFKNKFVESENEV